MCEVGNDVEIIPPVGDGGEIIPPVGDDVSETGVARVTAKVVGDVACVPNLCGSEVPTVPEAAELCGSNIGETYYCKLSYH